MKQSGQHIIPASKQAVWDALHDPKILKACVDGCQVLETLGDDAYTCKVLVKIGPVKASFDGEIHLVNPQPIDRYTLEVEAKGGAAGFGKGTAEVSLFEVEEGTRLEYIVQGSIGGKLAQIGTRLIQSFSRKLADRFFDKFSKQWQQ